MKTLGKSSESRALQPILANQHQYMYHQSDLPCRAGGGPPNREEGLMRTSGYRMLRLEMVGGNGHFNLESVGDVRDTWLRLAHVDVDQASNRRAERK